MSSSRSFTTWMVAAGFALVATAACDEMPTETAISPDADAVDVPIAAGTTVPGHTPGGKGRKVDADGNKYPDEGVIVNGHYTSVFAYEGEYGPGTYPQEDWYWDLGDGRIYGTVGSIDDLDETTLTVCDYVNNYRADFGNDPFMDSGWIQNHINCKGYDDNGKYNYLIVHETDPRYTGNPDWAIWGTWEYHILTISGFGNLVRPENHVGG